MIIIYYLLFIIYYLSLLFFFFLLLLFVVVVVVLHQPFKMLLSILMASKEACGCWRFYLVFLNGFAELLELLAANALANLAQKSSFLCDFSQEANMIAC